MESAAFVRVMIEELKEVDLDVVVQGGIALHDDTPHLVHIILLEERADVDHELLQEHVLQLLRIELQDTDFAFITVAESAELLGLILSRFLQVKLQLSL